MPAVSSAGLSSVECLSESCVTANEDLLAVKPNLFSGQINITASVAEFNVGGDCNEGGFAANTLRWELRLNGATVRHSGMLVAGGVPANSQCVNGRFLLYVNLAAVSEDNVNRTGLLKNASTRSAYDLVVQISGQAVAGGPVTSNSMNGKTTIPLVPL